jgi:hypothetical protein
MKRVLLGTGLCFFVVSFLSAQTVLRATAASAEADYEELPELKASEILRANILEGPFHKVREEVPTSSGANHFTIDSQFGVFEAEGNEELLKRMDEINAIARLKDVSRTDQYKEALIKAAKSPLAAAKNIINDPVNAISNVPKGIMKFMGRVGETAKTIGKPRKGEDSEGSQVEQIIGFSNTKRKVALSLGVDPYSTNTVLQRELDEISWATFAGGATFSLATLPIGGGVGMALTVTGVSGDVQKMLAEHSPADLRIMNRKSLLAMGTSEADAERFLGNNAFSPTAQTAFVLSLRSMNGVADRASFVRLAGRWSTTEPDANFCVQTAALMSKLHQSDHPLARLTTFGDFPICVAKDGTTVLLLQWDYAAWTAAAARFSAKVQQFAAEAPRNGKVLVAISGQASPRLRTELESLGDQLLDRLSPGPLK